MPHTIANEASKAEILAFITDLNPLVGDNACQLYHTVLLLIFRKLSQATISQPDIEYLNNCMVLTLTASPNIDPKTGLIISYKTDPKLLPELLKRTLGQITQTKRSVVYQSLELMRLFIAGTEGLNIDDEMRKYMVVAQEEPSLYLSVNHQKIPLVPFYLSCKFMFSVLCATNSKLFVNVKRLDEFRNILSTHQLTYQYDGKRKKFIVVPSEQTNTNSIGISIQMYSFLLTATAKVANSCFHNANHDEFISGFSNLDIAKIILCCAVAHPQIPVNAKGILKESLVMKLTESIECMSPEIIESSASAVIINHNEYSYAEYKGLAAYAIQNGIFNHKSMINRDLPVPFGVSHVQVVRAN